jgi:hypothetical protein
VGRDDGPSAVDAALPPIPGDDRRASNIDAEAERTAAREDKSDRAVRSSQTETQPQLTVEEGREQRADAETAALVSYLRAQRDSSADVARQGSGRPLNRAQREAYLAGFDQRVAEIEGSPEPAHDERNDRGARRAAYNRGHQIVGFHVGQFQRGERQGERFSLEAGAGRPDLSGKGPVPIVVVPQRFVGMPFAEARRAVQVFARDNLRGAFANSDTGWTITVPMTGVRKSTSKTRTMADLHAIAVLPELIETAILVETAPDRQGRQNVRAVHNFYAAMRIGEDLRRVRLIVIEATDGRRFYDQHSSALEESDPGAAAAVTDPALRSRRSRRGGSGSTINLGDLLAGVKYEDGSEIVGKGAADEGVREQRATAEVSPPEPTIAAENIPKVQAALREALEAIGLRDIGVAVVERLPPGPHGRAPGRLIAGYFDGLRQISVSALSRNPERTLRHEAIHAMRALGLFTEPEWQVLERTAATRWLAQYDIARRYAGQSREVLLEEGVAEAFADFRKGAPFPPGFRRVFQRIAEFLRRLGSALRGLGFQTAEDIFGRIETGEIGARPRRRRPVAGVRYQLTDAQQQDLARFKAGIGAPKRSPKQRVGEFLDADLADRLEYNILDDLAGFKRLNRFANGGTLTLDDFSSYVAARNSRGLSDVVLRAMAEGAPVWNEGATDIDTTVRAPLAILEDVGRARAEDFEAYMAARRARELMAQEREHHFDEAGIEAALALADAHPDFPKLFGEIQTYNDRLLDFVEASGLVGPETRAFFAEMHRNYVPFHRILDHDKARGPRARLGFAGQHPNFWKLKGGEQNIERPLIAYERNVHRLIEASVKNVVMLRAEQENAATGNAFMEPVPREARPGLVTNRQMIDDLARQGLEITGQDGVAPDALRLLWTLGHAPRGSNVVSLVRGGKPRFYEVKDAILLGGMTMLHRTNVPFIVPFRAAKRLLTAAVGIEPTFQLRNIVRDTGHVGVVTHFGFVPGLDSARGMREFFTKSPVYDDAFRAGIGMSSVFEEGGSAAYLELEARLGDRGRFGRIVNSPARLLRSLQRFESGFEYATRLGVYKKLRQQGAGRAMAAYQARDASTDFALRGAHVAVRILADTVPFLNARVQGLARTWRGAKEGTDAWYAFHRGFAMKGMLIAAASMMLYLAFRDDERYRELPDYQREMYWHWWVGDQHFKLPKPFEVGALFGSVPERALEAAIERNGAIFADALLWNLSETFNMGVFNPAGGTQLLTPWLRVYSNWDEFRERPIVPPWLERLKPSEQFREHTPQAYIALGRLLGVSPLEVQSLLDSYLGAWPGYIATATDSLLGWTIDGYPVPVAQKWTDLPGIRGFVGPDVPYTTKHVQDFYAMRREVEELHATMRHLQGRGEIDRARKLLGQNRKQLAIRDQVSRLNEQLQAVNRQMRIVQNRRGMTAGEKRERIDRLRAMKNRLARMSVRLKRFYDG